MIYAPPADIDREPRYRPSYVEVADEGAFKWLRDANLAMLRSSEGSNFFRAKLGMIESEARLKQLSKLREDWDSYGAEAPTDVSVNNASRVLKTLSEFSAVPDGILPSAEGGIAICFVRDDSYADIECLNSGEILAVKYRGNEPPRVWEVGESVADTVQTILGHFSE